MRKWDWAPDQEDHTVVEGGLRKRAYPQGSTYIASRRGEEEPPAITPEMIWERALDFLRRRGFVALSVAALAAAAAGLVAWYLLPLEYTAEGEIYFATTDGDLGQFKSTEQGIITGMEVAKRAVEMPAIKAMSLATSSADAAAALRRRIVPDSLPAERIIRVQISDTDPATARTLVNSVIEAYVEVASNRKSDESRRLEDRYEADRDASRAEIQRIKERQLEIARKVGQSDPEAIRKIVDDLRRQQLDKQNLRQGVQVEKIKLQKEIDVLSSTVPELTPEQEDRLQGSSPEDLGTQKALARMQMQADQIRDSSVLGEKDPEYQRWQRYIDIEQGKIIASLQARREKMVEALVRQQEAQVKSKKSQLTALEEQEKILDQTLLGLNRKIEDLDAAAAEIDRLRPELAAQQDKLDNADKQLTAVRAASWISGITPTPADLPTLAKSGKKRLTALVGGPIGAFAFVLGIFVLADVRVNLVTRPEHLEKTQSLPVLGTLPRLPDGRRLPTDDDFLPTARDRLTWISLLEAINSLRITLTFAPDRANNEGMSSLMITSPRDGEGKSTFAANLAVSLARTGIRVVLVEADMHRPTQFETFHVDRTPGLSEVLQGKARAADVLRETDYPGLWLLPAGSPTSELTPMLLPERVSQVIDELKGAFQMIIVDAPPVLPVYDAMVLGQHVDETVLMVRCHHSRFQTIGHARSRLESVGVNVAGLVVCNSGSAHRYGYYYESYRPTGDPGSSKNGTAVPAKSELRIRTQEKAVG